MTNDIPEEDWELEQKVFDLSNNQKLSKHARETIKELWKRYCEAVPEGWKLVPIEPDINMIAAWYRYKNGWHFHDDPAPVDTSDVGAYRAMMAVAPSPTTLTATFEPIGWRWQDGIGRWNYGPTFGDNFPKMDRDKPPSFEHVIIYARKTDGEKS